MGVEKLWLLPKFRRKVNVLRRRWGYEPDRICFVSGSYRSGTTAVARWLGSQSDVTFFSESRIFIAAHAFMDQARRFRQLAKDQTSLTSDLRDLVLRYYTRRAGYAPRRTVVDKEPLGPIGLPHGDYSQFLTSVRTIFPEVRLVIMLRNPVPTIWSMSQRKYGYSRTDLSPDAFSLQEHIENWCAAADVAASLAQEENVYICRFERLVESPEQESARILHFLGLAANVPFTPKATQRPAFDAHEEDMILSRTLSHVQNLSEAGV